MAAASSSAIEIIGEATVRKAVKALLKWHKLQSTHEQQEEEEDENNDDFIYLVVTLKKIPPKDLSPISNPIKIFLPHKLQSFSSICLIVGDKPTQIHSSKTTLASEATQKKLRSLDSPITKILKLSKLKSEYKSFDSKRNLIEGHDLFLADKRVVRLLPGVLGKQFYTKKKRVPVPVDLKGERDWKLEIDSACSSSLVCFGTGTCAAVRVGRRGVMEVGEVVENVVAAVDGIVSVVPKKWGGIRALHLKLLDSLALPIYDPDDSDGLK